MPQINWTAPATRQDMGRVVGKFIYESRPWHWWVTLTFRRPIGPEAAKYHFQIWARCTAREIRQHVSIAWVLDRAGGSTHVHTLLGFPEGGALYLKQLECLWLATAPGLTGYSWIRQYDEDRGAAFYIGAKTTHFEWGTSMVCPRCPGCRRKKGCIRTTAPF